MGMNNPHDSEGSLRDAALVWMKDANKDPSLRDQAEYYMDQWFKVLEKRVAAEMADKRIKQTAGDRMQKPKKPKKPEKQKGT